MELNFAERPRHNAYSNPMTKLIGLCILCGVMSPAAWGWGSYGHQQVNRAAVKLLGQDPSSAGLGKCFTTNLNFIQRLSITPDYDWKNLGSKPDAELQTMRMSTDHYEHPHHYFEADAFIKGEVTPESIRNLPSDDFDRAYSTQNAGGYPALFKANLEKINEVNPAKLTETQPLKKIDSKNPQPSQVAGANGSAPWRILQLYRLAKDALAAGKTNMAFMYMGAMGHYVGDMSQPFHASLNFDGDYFNGSYHDGSNGVFSDAAGIHHSFEGLMLETVYAKSLTPADVEHMKAIAKTYCELSPAVAADSKKMSSCISSHSHKANPNNDLWLSFAATEDAVMKSTDRSLLKIPIKEEAVVKEVLTLISTGYAYATPLLVSFSKLTTANPTHAPKETMVSAQVSDQSGDSSEAPSPRSISMTAINAMVDAKVDKDHTTIQIAEQRIGASATLLARLWLSIVAAAGQTPQQLQNCAELPENKIDEASGYSGYKAGFLPLVIKNYPYPVYIFPQLADRMPQSQKAKVKKPKKKKTKKTL